MSLNSKQLSFLITFFSMSIIVLSLYNIHLGEEKGDKDEYIVEMMLEEEDIEELLKEKEVLKKLSKNTPIKSHLAYNEAVKPSYGSPEPLQTLEELMAEKSYKGETNNELIDSEYNERIKALEKKRLEAQKKLGEKNAQKKEYTHNLAARRTSVSYSLVNRKNYKLPPPIYTCIKGGKVVVNIIVDAIGNVIKADLNKKSSNTSNGCLVDKAITYALKAKFNTSNKASQKGTITYYFQQKTQ